MRKKRFIELLIVGLLNLLLCTSAMATVYYVKNSGTDSASGTSDGNAWKSIARVNDYASKPGFKDGDIIQFKRGDVWRNDEPIGYRVNWGTQKTITIRDYGNGDKPRFDANTFQPIRIDGGPTVSFVIKNLDISGMDYTGDLYSIWLHDVNNLTLDGLYMDAYRGASKFPRTSGIAICLVKGNLEIMNCTIKNFVDPSGPGNWDNQDAHGIYTSYAVDGGKTSGTYKIHDNEIHNVEADCIQFKGIATTTKVYNNHLYNFGENALDFKNCSKTDIYNNRISQGLNFGTGGSGGGYSGITSHYKAKNYGPVGRDFQVHNNLFYDSPYMGIRMLSTTKNVKIKDNYFRNNVQGIAVSQTDDIEISGNVFMQTNDRSCSGYDCSAIRVFGDGSSGVNIHHNTIYSDSSSNKYGIVFGRDSNNTSAKIKSNIVYMTQKTSGVVPLYVDTDSGPLPTVTYNTYFNENQSSRVKWDGDLYTSSQQKQWNSMGHTGDLFSKPSLTDAQSGNLTVKSSTDSYGRGTSISYPYDDMLTTDTDLSPPVLQVISAN